MIMKKRTRRDKVKFLLDVDWALQEPIDFEHKKYVLLSYVQKCERNFTEYKLYPTFVELSLHLANVQTIFKEGHYFYTDKKFKSIDDEIVLGELKTQRINNLTEEQKIELAKILEFAFVKLFDLFNIGKSIWSMTFDNINVELKKNRTKLSNGTGYFYFIEENQDKAHIWKYKIVKPTLKKPLNKNSFEKIYTGEITDNSIISLIQKSLDKPEDIGEPIFQLKTNQNFPLDETLIPLFKRKVTGYIFQSVKLENKP